MVRVEAAKIQVPVGPAGTADSGDNDDLIRVNSRFVNGPDERIGHNSIATAATPNVWQFILP